MPRLIRRLIAAALVVGAAASLVRVGWPLARYRVDGASMEPAFRAGDRLLVNRLAYINRAPQPGDAVVLRDPEEPGRLLLKRVAAVPAVAPGELFVVGDNPAQSRDSRHFGAIPRTAIVGKAWRKY